MLVIYSVTLFEYRELLKIALEGYEQKICFVHSYIASIIFKFGNSIDIGQLKSDLTVKIEESDLQVRDVCIIYTICIYDFRINLTLRESLSVLDAFSHQNMIRRYHYTD